MLGRKTLTFWIFLGYAICSLEGSYSPLGTHATGSQVEIPGPSHRFDEVNEVPCVLTFTCGVQCLCPRSSTSGHQGPDLQGPRPKKVDSLPVE